MIYAMQVIYEDDDKKEMVWVKDFIFIPHQGIFAIALMEDGKFKSLKLDKLREAKSGEYLKGRENVD